ncbi:hypothetical protein DTO96_102138 [Ephemeroptericola cinctiostellae]|uniref:Uncharacterized protein n=1 Tax=Ephemeroptericola cinctiostellae TaxID=2268024 RepID=A0A345DDE6_9BURK|nr:hypothetical protein [Ephemeroptericola cinctiostellae]AXF86384.1 hypothetical protein DTO96_102138 [Ephemeroptericola cinctiostellae]
MDIKQHPQYNANDFKYLQAKGWTTQEIIQRWDEENKMGKPPCTWDTTFAQAKLQRTCK